MAILRNEDVNDCGVALVAVEPALLAGREFDLAGFYGIQRVIASAFNISTCEIPAAALADDDASNFSYFAVMQLNPKVLWV